MTKQEITDLTNRLVRAGALKEALEGLSIYVKGNDKYLENDLLLQTASFNRNHRAYTNRLISKEDYDIAIARLNYAITQIIDRLPEVGGNPEPVDERRPATSVKKILFLSANPNETVQLRLGKELREIKDSIESSISGSQLELINESAVRIPIITRAMQRQVPEVVHFSGHGMGEDGIVVEDVNGNPVLFPTSGLSRLFKRFKESVKCVVLNACYSIEQAEEISKHGIYVIGMNDAIGDATAIEFAAGFYQSIGEGNDIEFAFDMALVNSSAHLNDANTPELWLNGIKLDI